MRFHLQFFAIDTIIIKSVIEYVYESIDEEKADQTNINKGRSLTYWEVLDTI